MLGLKELKEQRGVWKNHFVVLASAMRIVRDRLNEHYESRGVSLQEMSVLMSASDAPQSQKRVAQILGINTNVMVDVLDEMEHKGLIVRKRNPENRKENILDVTNKGRAILKWADETYDEVAKKAWDPIPIATLNALRTQAASVITTHCERKASETLRG